MYVFAIFSAINKPIDIYIDMTYIYSLSTSYFFMQPQSSDSYIAEAQAYFDRVEADGGSVHDKSAVNTIISNAVSQGWYSSVKVWFAGAGGYKQTSGKVTKWYNMASSSADATQSNTAIAPTFISGALGTFGNPTLMFDTVGSDTGSTLLLGDLSATFATGATLFIVGDQPTEDGLGSLYATTTGTDQWWYLAGAESYPSALKI